MQLQRGGWLDVGLARLKAAAARIGREGAAGRHQRLGRDLAADVIINVTSEDPLQALLDQTQGRKADRVLDTTGMSIDQVVARIAADLKKDGLC